MKKVFVLALLFAYILCADPIPPPYINEFQTSPDSLQRIEVADYDDWYEWIIVTTNTCSCFVDSPFISDNFAVIDMENTYGNLDLNDTCDTIIVFFEDLWWADTVIYPADCLLAPEPYTSACSFEFNWDWYIDSTPTLGSENDDYPYCMISGAVFDLDSFPIKYAEVRASCGYPSCLVDTVNPNGSYFFTDLFPGNYFLIATHSDYQPETTMVSTFALCPAENINFYLSPGYGINEEITEISTNLIVYPNPFISKVTIIVEERRGMGDEGSRSSLLTPHSSVVIYDLSGRLIRTFSLPSSPFPSLKVTWDGRDENDIEVPPGVYFVKWSNSSYSKSKAVCKLR